MLHAPCPKATKKPRPARRRYRDAQASQGSGARAPAGAGQSPAARPARGCPSGEDARPARTPQRKRADAITSRVRAGSSRSSSRPSPAVSIAGWIVTVTSQGRISHPVGFASIARYDPSIVTGTIAAEALLAMRNAPPLNSCNSPERLRVPSGKIIRECPLCKSFTPYAIDSIPARGELRSTNKQCSSLIHSRKIGMRASSCFASSPCARPKQLNISGISKFP